MKKLFYLITSISFSCILLINSTIQAQEFYMVKDINPGTDNADYQSLIAVDSILYFVCNDGVTGYELWRSDGTEQGTYIVKDIFPGENQYGFPNASYPTYLVNLNGILFFQAYTDDTGYELWKSDGTEQGTVLVKDINPGDNSSYVEYLTASGDAVYFKADDGIHGFELWKTDGTESGTVMVTDIYPGIIGSDPKYIVDLDGTVLFGAYTESVGDELWKSDGTESGTVLVKDVVSGSTGSFPTELTNVNGTIFFKGDCDLWKSNGTTSGTVILLLSDG